MTKRVEFSEQDKLIFSLIDEASSTQALIRVGLDADAEQRSKIGEKVNAKLAKMDALIESGHLSEQDLEIVRGCRRMVTGTLTAMTNLDEMVCTGFPKGVEATLARLYKPLE